MPHDSLTLPDNALDADTQLLRYSRHIMLPQIDIEGQKKITQCHGDY